MRDTERGARSRRRLRAAYFTHGRRLIQRILVLTFLLLWAPACQSQAPFGESDELDTPSLASDELVFSPRRIEIARIKGLRQMNEPVWLDSLSQYDEIYRVAFSSTYHGPMIVRFQRKDDAHTLVARTMTQEEDRKLSSCVFSPHTRRPWTCPLGALRANVWRPLTREDWQRFKQLLVQASYWKLSEISDRIGMDGAIWALDAYDGQRSHRVERWSPEDGPFRTLCEFMIDAAGIHAPRAY